MTATKHPAAAYTFAYDFAEQLAGATIASIRAVSSTPAGLTEKAKAILGTSVLVFWADGADDTDYLTTVVVAASDGSTLVVTGTVQVRAPKLAIERGPWTQADLVALSAALANGLRSVTFADGRKTEYQSSADMLAVRNMMKTELAQATGRTGRRSRFIVARVGRR